MNWQIEPSQWDRFLESTGYGLAPDYRNLVGRAATDHPAWSEASAKLKGAIKHLQAGEDDDALRECLHVLEGIASPPYTVEAWANRLSTLPTQKANGLAELFSGFATYCNRVGHHRDRVERDGEGDLLPMPLDHWEAELAVAQAHTLVAYAIRLRSSGDLSS